MFRECIFLKNFGFYCPGCGGTRAVKALLHGHILESLHYHPIVVYVAVLLIAYTFFRRKPKVAHAYIAFIMILVQFVYKNLMLIIFHIHVI